MNEFELIQRYFSFADDPEWLHLGIGDDGAVLAPDPNQQIIVTDTLVEGVHFFAGADARSVGHKALAVNLSDLAAMGARPKWFTLNLTMPAVDEAWVAGFSQGLQALAKEAGICLIGGDTTSGPLAISITAAGVLSKGQRPITRAGAEVGGRLAVVGGLGLAGQAVAARTTGSTPTGAQAQALDFPVPQLLAGQQLHGVASAACDVSDGLLADLGHIAKASGCGFRLHGEALARFCSAPNEGAAMHVLSGGDDYALLLVTHADTPTPEWAIEIGVATESVGIEISEAPTWLENAFAAASKTPGYQHF